jgi:hypothetical protein
MNTAIKSLFLAIFAATGTALAGDNPTPAPAATPATPAAAPSATSGAKIKFEMPVYDFNKTAAGPPIKYTFVFTNTGNADLDVDVHPLCGCTTAGDWTHKVEPGKTGAIPIQVNSAMFSGPIDKSVNVTSNDKDQPTVTLHIKGTVWKPIDVNPTMAYFNILPDTAPPAPFTVHIVNNTDKPLTLEPPQSQNPAFSAQLKTNELGKSYDLLVSVTPPDHSGNVSAQITLKTSSTSTPIISVTAMANVQPAITLVPGQISLPGGPLPAPITNTLQVQNFGTNIVALSEPSVSAKGVDVQVKELNPGKVFSVTVIFPKDFEITSEIPVELSLKSTHPKYPVIRAPVTQAPRPPAPPTPPAHAELKPPLTLPAPQTASH